MEPFVIHTIPGSPFARAVIAVLIEKGADFQVAGIAPGTLKAEPHLSRQPFGRMPVIEHGDFVLYETQAILRYIDRVLPSPRLTPADPRAAARMDQLLNITDWHLFQGVGNVIAFQRVIGPMLMGLTTDEAACAAAMPAGHTVFGELSRLLGDKPFFTGEAPSLADFAIAPQLDFLAATPEWAELTRGRENLVRWLEAMAARPSLAESTMPKVAALAA